jgi:hypothetical protein
MSSSVAEGQEAWDAEEEAGINDCHLRYSSSFMSQPMGVSPRNISLDFTPVFWQIQAETLAVLGW